MGLDIYAGTLTRYYSHNWKTVVQQWAEENGYAFNRITPDGEPADKEEEMSTAEVQAAVENWRDQILSAISRPGQPPYTPWPEDNERPYYTDKPPFPSRTSRPTILGWADTEGYPADGTVDSDGQYSKADIPEHTQYDTQSIAKFAFSMFWRAMRFAEEQQVPILLDY